jgi:hypothetical protein
MHSPILRLGQTLFFGAHGQISPCFLLACRFAILAAFASQIFLALVQILDSTRFLAVITWVSVDRLGVRVPPVANVAKV